MKVIVDDKIPYIREAIQKIADVVVFAPGKDFTPSLVKDADALIVRTRTICDCKLLEGSSVKFIATATIGYDHIDAEYCRKSGIAWKNAPGCNAQSVAEYIQSVLVLLFRKHHIKPEKTVLGIVGLGNVGRKVLEAVSVLGVSVLVNDPPRADLEGENLFCSLKEIAEKCDIVTFHTPLNMESKYRTFHLADEAFFRSLRKKPIIINTSRGEVIDTRALLNAMDSGWVSDAVIDVWENEPDISRELLKKAFISTPHIAGYSADGKANATRMALDALCEHFGIMTKYEITPPVGDKTKIISGNFEDVLLAVYNPMIDSDKLKACPEKFEQFRNDYPVRREMATYASALNFSL